MRVSKEQAAANREEIVHQAARLFRERHARRPAPSPSSLCLSQMARYADRAPGKRARLGASGRASRASDAARRQAVDRIARSADLSALSPAA